jgi:hypothetical protein
MRHGWLERTRRNTVVAEPWLRPVRCVFGAGSGGPKEPVKRSKGRIGKREDKSKRREGGGKGRRNDRKTTKGSQEAEEEKRDPERL